MDIVEAKALVRYVADRDTGNDADQFAAAWALQYAAPDTDHDRRDELAAAFTAGSLHAAGKKPGAGACPWL